MTNFTSKIYQSALSSLSAQQAVIANISNNIANVNTEGYARRTIDLQTRTSAGVNSGLNLGSGVEATRVQRVNDTFLQDVLHSATGDSYRYSTENQFLGRLESLFGLSGQVSVVGEDLTKFYAALDDLALDPASIELRTAVLERANDLVTTMQNTFSSLESLQSEIDRRLETEIDSINSLTASIAEINGQISTRENNGQIAADERDQRDVLLAQLAERMSYNSVENSDGTVTISLTNGFTLVNGTTNREMEVTRSPSFDTTPAVGLNDGALNYIVFDYDTTGVPGNEAHIDLGSVIASGSGTLAGLMSVRGYPGTTSETGPFLSEGAIPEIAASIEAIARGLVVDFNNVYANQNQPDPADPSTWTNGNYDLDGNLAGTGGTPPFFFSLSGITMQGAGGLDAPEAGSGAPDEGLGFIVESDLNALLRENGGGTFNTVVQALQVAVTDARDIAISDAAGTVGDASGEEQNGTILSYLGQLQNADAGDSITLTDGQAYTVPTRSVSSGGTASFTFEDNLNDIYTGVVGRVGNLKARADLNSNLSLDNLTTVQSRRDELSGVSLDEEFSNLVRFQQAFEANARILRTVNELSDVILQLI